MGLPEGEEPMIFAKNLSAKRANSVQQTNDC